MVTEVKPPVPPFTEETARAKVKAAENAWNSRDPDVVAKAYYRVVSQLIEGSF